MTTRKTLYILTILLLILACDSEKVLYEVKLPKPKVIETSFGKTSSFLKWNIKKTREEIFRYALSYGIVGGATLNARKIIRSHTLGTGFRIKGLKEGKKHWVKVQAVYAKFSGPWSNVIEGITGKPMPPTDFKVKPNTEGKKWYVDVSWNDHPSNEKEKLTIKQYHVKCWDSANPATDVPLKYERSEKRYTASTKGTVLETSGKARYACSVQTETDKGTLSEIKQSTGIEFHDIEQAVLSATSAPWGTVITFSKVAEHTYKLKKAYSGVTLNTTKDLAEITATKPVSGVVVVAERTDYTGSVDSEEIEFTRQAGDTFSFATKSDSQEFNTRGNTFRQVPTLVDDVGDDTRDFVYSISPSGAGASIDKDSGEVSITVAAVSTTFTITASKAQSEKYEGQSASYTLEVQGNTDSTVIIKPALNTTSAPWGTSVTFSKVAEHTYKLKKAYSGVTLNTTKDLAEITATKPVSGVVVVAERTGYTGSVDSEEISFTRQAGDTFSFATKSDSQEFNTRGNTFRQVPTLVDDVGDDTRDFMYSISPSGAGASIDKDSGEVSITVAAVSTTFTITASKAQSEKYEGQSASYTLEVQGNTNTAAITKPALNTTSAPWGTSVTFPKVAGHRYRLEDDKGGAVSLADKGSSMTVTATKAVSGVVVVAKRTGYTGSVDSEEITFTRQAGDTFSFATKSDSQEFNTRGNTFTQAPTLVDDVGDDTRDFVYSISPSGAGASIDKDSGEVSITVAAVGKTFTITASKAQSEKYEGQSASYTLEVQGNTNTAAITKPALNATSARWGISVTFAKEAGHRYRLEDDKGGAVSLADKGSSMTVTATKAVSGVVVVAKRTGYTGSVDSEEITFTRQAGDTFSFATKSDSQEFNTRGNTFTQAPTLVDDVGDDTRDFVYSISPSGAGASIDKDSGEVSITIAAVSKTFTITASKAQSEKYEGQSASYTLEVQRNTDTAGITKPTLNTTSAPWGTSVTFAKEAGHRYRLEDDKGGAVSLAEKGSSMTVTATKPVSGVVVVAERPGYTGSVDSDAIEFTRQAGDTFSFATKSDSQMFNTNGNKFRQAPTLVDDVGDTRDFVYSISPNGSGAGASIDKDSGEVSITVAAVGKTFTITASKAQSEKYEEQSASYTLEVQENTDTAGITKPALNTTSALWGTSVTFAKVAEHTYKLKKAYSGVRLDISTTPAEITATKAVSGVVVVAERTGYTGSVDSEAIEFTHKYKYTPATKAALKAAIKAEIRLQGNHANLNDIDTSAITNMSGVFSNTTFNGDISQWDVSKVTDMQWMFYGARAFNQDISAWNVSQVTDMQWMFYGATAFNGDISEWNVSQVTDMTSMFDGAIAFNQDISEWNVSQVTTMRSMFASATSFNQDISAWDVSQVTKMKAMFKYATAFNGDISEWNVSQVTSMRFMFRDATAFNQNISAWDVSKVTNMSWMFYGATAFNQNLESWGRRLHVRIKANNMKKVSNMFENSGASVPAWCTGNCK